MKQVTELKDFRNERFLNKQKNINNNSQINDRTISQVKQSGSKGKTNFINLAELEQQWEHQKKIHIDSRSMSPFKMFNSTNNINSYKKYIPLSKINLENLQSNQNSLVNTPKNQRLAQKVITPQNVNKRDINQIIMTKIQKTMVAKINLNKKECDYEDDLSEGATRRYVNESPLRQEGRNPLSNKTGSTNTNSGYKTDTNRNQLINILNPKKNFNYSCSGKNSVNLNTIQNIQLVQNEPQSHRDNIYRNNTIQQVSKMTFSTIINQTNQEQTNSVQNQQLYQTYNNKICQIPQKNGNFSQICQNNIINKEQSLSINNFNQQIQQTYQIQQNQVTYPLQLQQSNYQQLQQQIYKSNINNPISHVQKTQVNQFFKPNKLNNKSPGQKYNRRKYDQNIKQKQKFNNQFFIKLAQK